MTGTYLSGSRVGALGTPGVFSDGLAYGSFQILQTGSPALAAEVVARGNYNHEAAVSLPPVCQPDPVREIGRRRNPRLRHVDAFGQPSAARASPPAASLRPKIRSQYACACSPGAPQAAPRAAAAVATLPAEAAAQLDMIAVYS